MDWLVHRSARTIGGSQDRLDKIYNSKLRNEQKLWVYAQPRYTAFPNHDPVFVPDDEVLEGGPNGLKSCKRQRAHKFVNFPNVELNVTRET